MAGDLSRLVRLAIGWMAPVALIVVLILTLRGPITFWLRGAEFFDQEAIREWIREARVESAGLPDLARSYLDMLSRERELLASVDRTTGDELAKHQNALRAQEQRLEIKREEIHVFLKALGNPPTRLYRGQLPLFPLIYRISLQFEPPLNAPPIAWDSQIPREASQYRTLASEPISPGATVTVLYHLHAYHQVQAKERQDASRRLLLGGLGILATLAGGAWIILFQRRQRLQERQRLLAEQQASEAERRRLEAELLHQEAERKHDDAQRQNLELKSQLFANIGIMAGSYAHNIKNLLVRPNDLLRRCLEERSTGESQDQMLREVKDILGTVTERLQQILQTVRRDPNNSETTRVDLAAMVSDMHRAWRDLAHDKWKMNLTLEREVDAEDKPLPLWIAGDRSHVQQAIENLVFNARDATFEMRNHLREKARLDALGEAEKRQAVLAAASWRGNVVLRVKRQGDRIVLEVIDNGIGMTDDIRANCLKTHFSTKRNNALFAGLNAGMGLGLSFVGVVLSNHHAHLKIESTPLHGATFRIDFPSAEHM